MTTTAARPIHRGVLLLAGLAGSAGTGAGCAAAFGTGCVADFDSPARMPRSSPAIASKLWGRSSGFLAVQRTTRSRTAGEHAALSSAATFTGWFKIWKKTCSMVSVSYTHLRAHETGRNLV